MKCSRKGQGAHCNIISLFNIKFKNVQIYLNQHTPTHVPVYACTSLRSKTTIGVGSAGPIWPNRSFSTARHYTLVVLAIRGTFSEEGALERREGFSSRRLISV